MKLPRHDEAIVPQAKIVAYLLNLAHPVGRSKAVFFLKFGFTLEAWDTMAKALLQHAGEHDVTKVENNEEGKRYVIEGVLHTPDRRDPFVRSVWFVEKNEKRPQFVTAYPVKKRPVND